MDMPVGDSIEDLRRIATLEALYDAVERQSLSPAWITREVPLFTPEPKARHLPAHWSYAKARALLEAAGPLIDVRYSERRNFVLRNPAPGTNFETTRTQIAAWQMIMPGEVAPSHRHSSHALRVILDAKGAWSVVDGTKTPMESGDVVLTPGRSWHGHGHDGSETAYWLDILDIPFTHLLEPVFFELMPHGQREEVREVAETGPFRFSAAQIARDLDAASAPEDGRHGPRITLPTPSMPSMELLVERLAAGTSTRRHRSTGNRVFAIMAGSGRSTVGDQVFDWQFGDMFVAPCWTWFSHTASSDAQIFTCTDEPVLRFANYLYEDSGF